MSDRSILFLINSFTVGGAERVFVDDILALKNRGWEVEAAVLFQRGEFAKELDVAGVRINELAFASAGDMAGVQRLAALIREHKYSVVISTLNEANAAARRAKKKDASYKLVTREANMADVKGIRYKLNDIFLGSYSDKIVAVSQAVVHSVAAYAPWLSNKMIVLYNGTDVDRKVPERSTGTTVRLMTIGSLTQKKDHEVLIRALTLLPPIYSVSIIGSGTLYEELDQLISDLRLTDRARLLGRQSRHEVYAALESHDLFVLPSKREGCPNVVSEAQAMGLGVVAFAIPGMDEFISPKSGVLVRERTPQAFAHGIEEAAKRRIDLGRAGREEVVKTRSTEAHVKALVSILESLL